MMCVSRPSITRMHALAMHMHAPVFEGRAAQTQLRRPAAWRPHPAGGRPEERGRKGGGYDREMAAPARHRHLRRRSAAREPLPNVHLFPTWAEHSATKRIVLPHLALIVGARRACRVRHGEQSSGAGVPTDAANLRRWICRWSPVPPLLKGVRAPGGEKETM